MRMGISITSNHRGLDDATAVGHVIERAKVAAAAELDHLSLGDHHAMGRGGPYVANVPMLGRIMADWPRDRPIGLLLLLPLWNPVLAAEQIGTLAAMTDAPFIVQTGIGSGRSQFAAMGTPLGRRGAMTDSAIAAMKALFAGETVDVPELGISGAQIAPRPPRPVEWWIGSGMAPVAIERAAREGDAWYISPGAGLAELREGLEQYRERCEANGTTPRVCLRRDVLVAVDHDRARALGQAVVDAGYRGMSLDQLVVGGVESVVEQLQPFADLGIDDIVSRTIAVEQSAALESIEQLGAVRTLLA